MTRSLSGQPAESPTGSGGIDDARCALCGQESGDDQGLLRQLGEAPVVITVCADSEGCVTRFAAL